MLHKILHIWKNIFNYFTLSWSIVSALCSQSALTKWCSATSSKFFDLSKTWKSFSEIFGISCEMAVVNTVDCPFSAVVDLAVISPVSAGLKPRIHARCCKAESNNDQDCPNKGPYSDATSSKARRTWMFRVVKRTNPAPEDVEGESGCPITSTSQGSDFLTLPLSERIRKYFLVWVIF